MELLYEIASSLHCAASSKLVVVQQNHVVLVDGIIVDFDSVLAILLGVPFLHSIARQFAGLAA